ncbi:cyclin-B1-3-like [Brassica napus]|uniref:cyclin-B1-3-like n=1 Tax=Brassica napus TaxID=3708 RepID=UPI002078CA40|nr:cyclin-B1-3-like [Brassica napus]
MATRQVRDDPPVHVKKNRRALWDIGNITSIPRVQGGKINHRPLTCNFRAKLLENAQAANKKQISVDKASVLDEKPEAVKAFRYTNEVAKAKKDKKKVTHSSILNALSKAASSKTRDIDSVDKDNDLAALEYVEDMYTFYKQVENESKPQIYMQTQPEINEKETNGYIKN